MSEQEFPVSSDDCPACSKPSGHDASDCSFDSETIVKCTACGAALVPVIEEIYDRKSNEAWPVYFFNWKIPPE